MEWYPENKDELNFMLNKFLIGKKKKKEIHGVIVPHAGYQFSGAVAGKAFGMLNKVDKAVVIGPSHYSYLNKAVAADKDFETSLGRVKVINNGFETADIHNEHSIMNQIPFLQKLNVKEVLLLMVGDINNECAKQVAEKISKINALFVFSTDLSHFLPYEEALKKDKKSMDIIKKLDFGDYSQIDACGRSGLLVLFYLCEMKKWKPKLIEYKNSGDVTGDRSSVVGYASFVF